MRKDFFYTILINFIITFLTSILGFIINKYFIFYIGMEKLGLMKLFTQLLAYLNLAEIGIASASAYALYKPLSEKNYDQISIIMNTLTSLYNKIFLFILIIGLFLNPVIPFFIKDKIIDKYIYLYWSLYVINTALGYSFIKYSILFTADQKYKLVRLIQGGTRILVQVLQIYVIIKFNSFFIFILLLIFDNIVQYIFYNLYYKRYYKYIFKTKLKNKSITDNLKNLFWHKVAGLVVFNTDLILISKFISLKTVGIYSSYLMINQIILTVFGIVLNVLTPKIGKYIAENSKEKIFIYWKKLNILFLWFSAFFSFCTYKLIGSFIKLWLGEQFILPNLTLILIIINLFIQCFRSILEIFKEGSGFFDDIHLPISEAVINFVISIILVQYIGLNGVIMGTLVSNILIICIAKPILVFKRCFDKSWKDYIKIYGNYLVLITLSLFLCESVLKFINLNKINLWIDWIIYSVITGSIVLIITFLVFIKNKSFRELIKEIKKTTFRI